MKKLKDLITEVNYGSEVAEQQFKMIANKLKTYKNLKIIKTDENLKSLKWNFIKSTLFYIKIRDNANNEYEIYISK